MKDTYTLREIAREQHPEALRILFSVAHDDAVPAKYRRQAAKLLLDRLAPILNLGNA